MHVASMTGPTKTPNGHTQPQRLWLGAYGVAKSCKKNRAVACNAGNFSPRQLFAEQQTVQYLTSTASLRRYAGSGMCKMFKRLTDSGFSICSL